MLRIVLLGGLAATMVSLPVAAASYRHPSHRRVAAHGHRGATYDQRVIHASQEPYGSGLNNPYANYYGPGSAVLNQTERARSEPGVTLELAPDAKETATGGPVGGVPGFDGS